MSKQDVREIIYTTRREHPDSMFWVKGRPNQAPWLWVKEAHDIRLRREVHGTVLGGVHSEQHVASSSSSRWSGACMARSRTH